MCAIDYCDERAVIWRETQPRARGRHVCCECGRFIQPGETYLRVNHLFDGRWWSDATCAHCRAAAAWLNYVCGGYVQCGLYEELKEHWDEGYASILMGRLILGMRKRWHDGADPVPEVERIYAVARWSMDEKVKPRKLRGQHA